ncbi:winged helix-turn-helix transcriptional regulator [Xanthomonas sp. 3058]|uniref:winged helix-turn-helix transcriptional regulator n=1 Tax=Xanthomonas sp. 3058 TaxID=3035314 RepID=UPI00161677F1|nr:winged helix-turn-helix transcriptional regulator [Xanthomonas sp. 3058]MBB5865488.1 DNA-binding winged helix-turn-helix (wHTH) protein/Tfp pilus assembly protein PilF [Xanthomonas sp. 3058]
MRARYRLDDLRIDVARQRVERDGVVLGVGGLSFHLLHYLLQQGQRVVDFDELIQNVWAPALVNEETVTQRVRLLRQALGDDSRQPRYVRSVRGQGYQLCVPVQQEQAPPAGAVRRHAGWILAACALLACVGVGTIWWLQSREAPPAQAAVLQRADYYAGIGQRDDNERAIGLYRQRLQDAPDDRQAQLGLSRAYSARVCQYDADTGFALQALQLADGVVAAQPRLAAAHAARAYALDCQGRNADALTAYERALQLDPNADAVRGSAAYLYERQGKLVQALSANLAVRDPTRVRFLPIQIASNLSLLGYASAAEARYRNNFQLYPDNAFSNLAWPTFLFEHGRAAEAQTALNEALGRGTAYAGLWVLQAELAWMRGDTSLAHSAALHALQLRPQGSFAQTVAWALHAQPVPMTATLHAHAQELLVSVERGGDPFDAIDAAVLLLCADAPEAAMRALQRAETAGYRNAGYLRHSPLLKPLRSLPEFAALLARIDAELAAQRAQLRARNLLPADATSERG